MQYSFRGTTITKISESSGVIQNIGQYEIEISPSEDFAESFVLRAGQEVTFNKQLYIRIRDINNPVATVNVVSFITIGGGTASNSDNFDDQLDSIFSGETVPDESVASDENFDDELDDIFSGNGTATIDVDDDFIDAMDSIFGGN